MARHFTNLELMRAAELGREMAEDPSARYTVLTQRLDQISQETGRTRRSVGDAVVLLGTFGTLLVVLLGLVLWRVW